MAAGPPSRPLSPHLSIWKWQPNMAVSIFHRVTGHALALAGLAVFAWWLVAAALGPEAYETFRAVFSHWLGQLMLIGITWAFFQHLFSGLRHFWLDAGLGYDLGPAQRSAMAAFALALAATAAVWAFLLLRAGA
jgi:succinate dehydrogenase / fumarate reductase cytochrome b subunit